MSDSAFKNFINASVVAKIGAAFKTADPKFDQKRFTLISKNLEPLELKERVLMITGELRLMLPTDFKKASVILEKVLRLKALKGFELWPISEYISRSGLEHFDESMELMYLLTQDFTSEFAVRSWLLKDPVRVLEHLMSLVEDQNVHVRRWISEGSRPILPWGGKIPSLIKTPGTLQLLEKLKFDEELYVRKSVANHLNDISKNHPELVVETLKSWVSEAPEVQLPKINWIKRHALRTLIKKGHPGALGLMGVSSKTDVRVSGFKLHQKIVKVGEKLTFELTIESSAPKPQVLIIDYLISFLKSNGSSSHKVFKLKGLELPKKGSVKVVKSHSLKKITTMVFYPGKHELLIQVNGKIVARAGWVLKL